MIRKDADHIANSVNRDQTALLEAWHSLFAYPFVSKSLGSLRYNGN